MIDEIIGQLAEILDQVANTRQGHKMVDDLGSIVGRLYKNLTDQGLPVDAAAAICASLGKSQGGK